MLKNNFTVKLPHLHEHQQRVFDNDSRYRVLAAGRRFGKSTLAKVELLDAAINQAKRVWFISPTYNNVMTHWRDVKRLVGNLPTYKNEQQKYMEFEREDGRVGSLAFKSGERPDNLLGDGLDYVVIDEAAYQDAEIWERVLRPALSDRQGRALFISTPNGTQNWFYSLYLKGIDPLEERWQAFRFNTVDSPYIPASEVEDAKTSMPELKFRQEYLAEFVSEAGGVFRGVDKAAIMQIQHEPDHEHHKYYAGIDWGRKNDFTVVSIFNEIGEQVYIDRFTDIGWNVQYSRIAALNEKWRFVKIKAEANSVGSANIEALVAAGLPVEGVYMTNVMKTQLVENAAAAIEHDRIKLLSNETPVGKQQIGEMLSMSMYRTNGGLNITYKAAGEGHDDTVIAMILGVSFFRKAVSNKIKVSGNPFYRPQVDPTHPRNPDGSIMTFDEYLIAK